MDFQTYHKYRRLVRRGLAPALCCATCEFELVLGIGPKDEPVLKCYTCNSTITPGKDTNDKVRAIVTEHFL